MITNQTYEEVYQILSYMDKETVMKIPIEILNKIKNERDKSFITKIDKNDIFNLKNVTEETIDMLLWLDVNYCMDSQQKQNIMKDFTYKNNMNEPYYFEKNLKNNKTINNSENMQISLVKNKETLWQKLIKKLKIYKKGN